VFLVMFLFLQNIRATLIPSIAVAGGAAGNLRRDGGARLPINTLSMFGWCSRSVCWWDDAIVVVENVERRDGRRRALAARSDPQGDGQITGALIGWRW